MSDNNVKCPFYKCITKDHIYCKYGYKTFQSEHAAMGYKINTCEKACFNTCDNAKLSEKIGKKQNKEYKNNIYYKRHLHTYPLTFIDRIIEEHRAIKGANNND